MLTPASAVTSGRFNKSPSKNTPGSRSSATIAITMSRSVTMPTGLDCSGRRARFGACGSPPGGSSTTTSAPTWASRIMRAAATMVVSRLAVNTGAVQTASSVVMESSRVVSRNRSAALIVAGADGLQLTQRKHRAVRRRTQLV